MKAVLSIRYPLTHISAAVQEFWAVAERYKHITFSGGLGAGKTTFIHALCDFLNVEDAVSSPTYALVNEYHFKQKDADRTIFHMDWYRLADEDEAIQAGMEDCWNNDEAYSFVEWPERAEGLLLGPYLSVVIEQVDDMERVLNVYLK